MLPFCPEGVSLALVMVIMAKRVKTSIHFLVSTISEYMQNALLQQYMLICRFLFRSLFVFPFIYSLN